MFSFICAGKKNNRDAADLRRHRAHYDVTVMQFFVRAKYMVCASFCYELVGVIFTYNSPGYFPGLGTVITLSHCHWRNYEEHGGIACMNTQHNLCNQVVSQIPQCMRQISHNAPFCDRNVHTCAHFCYKMVHCGIFVYCILGRVN